MAGRCPLSMRLGRPTRFRLDDVVPRVGVEAGGLPRGWLVGAGRALGLGGLPGGGDVVAWVGVEAGGLAGGRLVGAGRALGLGGLPGGGYVVAWVGVEAARGARAPGW